MSSRIPRAGWLVALCCLLVTSALTAQSIDFGKHVATGERELSMADALSGRLRPRSLQGLQWHSDSARITWVRNTKAGPELVAAPATGGETEVLLRSAALSEAWKAAGFQGGARVTGGLRWQADGSMRWVRGRSVYRVDLDPLRVTELLRVPARGVGDVAYSAGDQVMSYVKDGDVFVVTRDGAPRQVTRGGHDDVTYGVSVSRSEIGITNGMWWSPDGRRLAYYKEDRTQIPRYPYVDFTPTPARLRHGRYPMAGGKDSIVYVGVYDVRADKTTWLETDPTIDEYLTNVTWGPKSEELFVVHVNRGQDTATLVAYDATTGKRKRVLFTERDDQWIEPELGPQFVPDGSGRFVWISPREGFDQPYLYGADGKPIRKLTKGAFDITTFRGWNADGTGFFAEGPGDNPRENHLFFVPLEGGERRVTQGRGQHRTAIAPNHGHVLDTHSNLELPLAIDVVSAEGKPVRRVHEAENPLAEFRLGSQRFFRITADDKTPLYGHVIFPPKVDPTKKYPVIHYVYGGPHAQLIQDRWLGGGGRWIRWMHYMASRGYVVIRLDNRGTPRRGIEFEQAIHRRLGTCEVADQTAALEWLHSLGITDRARVGVHGWSYGGFMTLSLMTRAGDKYCAGVSGAPVTDWRYYEVGYGERYMDTPQENPDGYKTANPANHVKGIKGRLLVVHGTDDDVVMWQNTIAFLDKCIKQGVEVETMIYPGEKHGLRGKSFSHFLNKMTRFFDRELKPAQ